MKCADCQFLDLKTAGGYAKLGMAKCKAHKLDPATFVTSCFARECAKFQPAAAGVIAKRMIFLTKVAVQPVEHS